MDKKFSEHKSSGVNVQNLVERTMCAACLIKFFSDPFFTPKCVFGLLNALRQTRINTEKYWKFIFRAFSKNFECLKLKQISFPWFFGHFLWKKKIIFLFFSKYFGAAQKWSTFWCIHPNIAPDVVLVRSGISTAKTSDPKSNPWSEMY